MLLRNIFPDAVINNNGATNQFQFYGLVQKYRPIVVSGQVDLAQFNPYHIIIDGEFVWNSAFNPKLMQPGVGIPSNATVVVPGIPLNNRAPTPDGSFGPFNGGDQGWMTRITVGNKDIKDLGDWNVHVGYKYLQSDATLDAFVDSDFGLGGTNLKGYFVGGNLGISQNVWASLRWMSANNISGIPYAVDVLLVDLNAKF
jgi:putative porin